MNVVILVVSCQKNRDKQSAVAETWFRDLPENVRGFFVEGGHEADDIIGDRIVLRAPDKYGDLAAKVLSCCRLIVDRLAFDHVFKCDDDSYVCIPRLMRSGFENFDYAGLPIKNEYSKEGIFASGCGYFISRASCEIIAKTPDPAFNTRRWWYGTVGKKDEFWLGKTMEDIMVGDILRENGIDLASLSGISIHPTPSPYEDPSLMICHYVRPAMMRRIHGQRNRPIFLNAIWLRLLRWARKHLRIWARKIYVPLKPLLPTAITDRVGRADAAFAKVASERLW